MCERLLVPIRPDSFISGAAGYCVEPFRAGCRSSLGYRRLQSDVDFRASAGGPGRGSVRTTACIHDRYRSLRRSVGTVCDRDLPRRSIGLARVARDCWRCADGLCVGTPSGRLSRSSAGLGVRHMGNSHRRVHGGRAAAWRAHCRGVGMVVGVLDQHPNLRRVGAADSSNRKRSSPFKDACSTGLGRASDTCALRRVARVPDAGWSWTCGIGRHPYACRAWRVYQRLGALHPRRAAARCARV